MLLATAQNQVEVDPQHNASQIMELIEKAAQDGADFVHFPEGALSGYVKAQIKSWHDVDWQVLERELLQIQRLCASRKIGAAIGCAHKNPGTLRPFNSLYVIDTSGHMVARYDKRFCSNSEINDWYSAGTTPLVVEVKGMKLGFALCIEIQFPEIFMEYGEVDADCVLFSAYNDAEMFRIQAQGHAACNNFWISYSVPVNASHEQASCLIGPDGRVIGSCQNGSLGYILNEIDPHADQWDIPCKQARPWRKLAREGDIYRPYQLKE